jgi:hypothetical protein
MAEVTVAQQPSNAGPRQFQLNPERAPALIAKYQKMLGKDLSKIQVEYTPTGVNVWVWGLGDYLLKNKEGQAIGCSLAAFKLRKAEVEKPSEEKALTAFKNKFEVRLNLPFPDQPGLASSKDEDIRAFLNALPFDQRRAMLMSNKQFKAAYPNGFRA